MLLLVFAFVFLLVVLLTVAFYTLMERKIMGYIHLRVGPNNLVFQGLVQPLLDAFKLLSNSYTIPSYVNILPYFISPYLSLGVSLLLWLTVVPLYFFMSSCSYSLVVFACVTSIIVFPLIISGWSSNSKYTLIGALRSVAQSISYEAVITTLIVLLVCFFGTYSLNSIIVVNSSAVLYLFYIWLFCTLAESHRAPFDFSESESELVSGYNTEYSGALFAYVFLSEYSTLLVGCFVIVSIFFFFISLGPVVLPICVLIMSILMIIIRVTYCRFRYDLLMKSAWTSYLPSALLIFLIYLVLPIVISIDPNVFDFNWKASIIAQWGSVTNSLSMLPDFDVITILNQFTFVVTSH